MCCGTLTTAGPCSSLATVLSADCGTVCRARGSGEDRFPASWKVLEASTLSQAVSAPVLFSLALSQRLEPRRNNPGGGDLESPGLRSFLTARLGTGVLTMNYLKVFWEQLGSSSIREQTVTDGSLAGSQGRVPLGRGSSRL